MSYNQLLTPEQFKEDEKLLQTLKLADLTRILDKIGLKKNGLKHELLSRLLSALKNPLFQLEISRNLEMYRKNVIRPPSYSAYNNTRLNYNNLTRNFPGGATMHSAQSYLPEANVTMASTNLKIVPLPFFDILAVLLEPVHLPPTSNGLKSQQRQQINIMIPSEHFQHIKTFNEINPLPRVEVQLRFFDTSDLTKPQKDEFPLNCGVKINERMVTLPNVIPTNKPNTEPKRPSRPLPISEYCKMRQSNRILVEWTGDKRSWAVSAYIVKKLTSNILYERMINNKEQHKSSDLTKNEIIKKLSGDDEDGINMDILKIGLLCPLSKVRMNTPVRCKDCTHLQSFDLYSYLMMNEKRPVWNCPVCSGYAPYDRLMIEEYFKEVLDKVDKNIVEVQLKNDGSFEVLNADKHVDISSDEEDEDLVKKKSTAKAVKSEDIIVLSDSDDDNDDNINIAKQLSLENQTSGSSTEPRTTSDTTSTSNSLKRKEIEVITLDDTPPRPVKKPRENPPTEPTPSTSSISPPPVFTREKSPVVNTTSSTSSDSSNLLQNIPQPHSEKPRNLSEALAGISGNERKTNNPMPNVPTNTLDITSFSSISGHGGAFSAWSSEHNLIGRQLTNLIHPLGSYSYSSHTTSMPNTMNPEQMMSNNTISNIWRMQNQAPQPSNRMPPPRFDFYNAHNYRNQNGSK